MKLVSNRNFTLLVALTILSVSCLNKNAFQLRAKTSSLFQLNKLFLQSKTKKLHEKFEAKTDKSLSLSLAKSNQVINSNQSPVFQGWLKYLEISEDNGSVPECFNKNKMFFLQMTENQSINTVAKDNMGYINIPNEQYFWFELDSQSVTAFTSRNPRYRKKENCLKLVDLVPEVSTNPCRGGVEDVGNFTEGYCFMLKFLRYTKHYIWELCADTPTEKDQWMNRISRLQQTASMNSNLGLGPQSHLSIQHIANPLPTNSMSLFNNPSHISHSITHISGGLNPMGGMNNMMMGRSYGSSGMGSYPMMNSFGNGGFGSNSMMNSNGWAPAGDWSPCSQACGNGFQRRPLRCMRPPHCLGPDFEERMCMIKACKADLDEKMGTLQIIADGNWELLGTWSSCSKPCGGGIQTIQRRCMSNNCQGDPFLQQACNMNPCQGNNMNNNFMMNNMNIIDPLNKNSVLECQMIQGNMNVMNMNGGFNQNGLPSNVHVILTSNHLDIYPINQMNNYSGMVPQQSFILSHITDIHQMPGQGNNCFQIRDDMNSNLNLCGNSNPGFDWMKKIEDYKSKCNNKILDKIQTDMEHCLTPVNAEQKLHDISRRVMDEQLSTNRNKGMILERQFQEFQNQVRDLLNKEDAYESNLENQERERITREKMQMQELVSREESRARGLAMEMQMLKTNENDYEIKEKAIKRKMKNMMDDIQRQINQKRSLLIDRLERMRRMHEIEQKIAAKKLIDIKRQVGSEILSMNKRGSPDKCFSMRNPMEISQYCTLAYHDVDLQNECKNPKQFCYMCCDAEIGNNNKDSNSCCYSRCDMVKRQGACSGFYEMYHIDDIIVSHH